MSEITNAIKQICEEKGLSYEAVIATVESALAAAYRKDFGEKNQNIRVEFDPESGKSKVFDAKTVVEDMPEEPEEEEKTGEGGEKEDKKIKKEKSGKAEKKKKADKPEEEKPAGEKAVEPAAEAPAEPAEEEEEKRRFNPRTEIQLKDAKLIKKSYKIDDEIITKLEVPDSYGRMAAQTAKQVIIQKLREAEREMIFNEFKDKEKEVIAGVVQRQEGRIVLVDLGKAVGVLPADEQIYRERYVPGQRIKVYVKGVSTTSKGPEIILSRTSEEILKKVFYLEIPEVSNGLVEIKAIAREAGNRSKVAVAATGENVDPIGSCVGQRGARIQTIIGELGGEKIDIINYNEDSAKFIANALAPAKIFGVEINEKEKKAVVKVTEDQLSLAIGKDGQNVRLAAHLTGWKIDIMGEKSAEEKKENIDIAEEKTEEAEGEIKEEKEQAEAAEEKMEKAEEKVEKEKEIKEEKPGEEIAAAEEKAEKTGEKIEKEKEKSKKKIKKF